MTNARPAPPPDYDSLLASLRTTAQVCVELGITKARVYQLAAARGIPKRMIGRERVFTIADVDAMRHRRQGRPPSKALAAPAQ